MSADGFVSFSKETKVENMAFLRRLFFSSPAGLGRYHGGFSSLAAKASADGAYRRSSFFLLTEKMNYNKKNAYG